MMVYVSKYCLKVQTICMRIDTYKLFIDSIVHAMFFFSPQRMNQGYKPHIELPNPTGPGVQTVQVPVPAQKCGLVIGKGN